MESRICSTHFASSIETGLLPFPDETTGSIAARYHLWTCNSKPRKSLIELFGTVGVLPNAALPTRLGNFCNALGSFDTEVKVAVMISNHTLLPYFSFFGMRTQVSETIRAMIGPYHPKATAGLLAGTFGAADVLRYCPACAKFDSEQYGIPYWHRSHQLPEVAFCHSHKIPLREYSSSKDLRFRHALPIPPQIDACELSLVCSDSQLYRHQVQLAVSSSLLLTLDQTRVSSKKIHEAYQDKLIDLRLARKSGRVDQISLRSELCAYYQNFIFLSEGKRLCHEGKSLNWLERIVRKPRTRQHPVLHLLLTNFLFSGPAELVEYIDKPIIKKKTIAVSKNSLNDARIRKLLVDDGMSLRQAAMLMGTTVTTLKVQALEIGIPVTRRPKYIASEVEALMLADLVKGDMVEDVASRYHLSLVSVYRALKCNPAVKAERLRVLHEKEIEIRRGRFLQRLGVSGALVKNVRSLSPQDYTWLWKNDRIWLAKTLSERSKPCPQSASRVNWTKRDEDLVGQVQKAVLSILMWPGKPVRVTVNEIIRRIGKISLLQKKLENLPRTADLLATVVETTLSFQIRRIDWVIATKTGPFASVSSIARAAGVSDPIMVKRIVEKYLTSQKLAG